MPEKYHIHTEPAPPRFRPVGKLGIVDWREDCSSCHNCVKRDCVYGLWRDEADALHGEAGYLDYVYQCKGCLNCIQDCTKGILTRVANPEFQRLGDEHYTPEIVLTTWFQAETGRIPVSGAGFGGQFTGPGFDFVLRRFDEVYAHAQEGGQDVAELTETPGDDHLQAEYLAGRESWAALSENNGALALLYEAFAFDLVRAHRTTGNDTIEKSPEVDFLMLDGGWQE